MIGEKRMESVKQNSHRIEGKVTIPEEKRDEFNRNVFTILKMCGIRKVVKTKIDRHEVTTVCMPEADEHGIVSFDYSIFEQRQRDIATYNIHTNELSLPYCDYSQFGFAMCFIMTMQEAYSEGHCCFMEGSEICDVRIYAKIMEFEMDIYLSFPQRKELWNKEIVTEKKEKSRKSNLYIIFSRENADEFLEFGDEKELELSEDMRIAIAEWKDRYCEISDAEVETLDIESELCEIIENIETVWKSRYVDKEFVDEFMKYKHDNRYKKAIFLYKEVVEVVFQYFPELTKKQASKWIIQSCITKAERVQISAYQSLMMNDQYRKKLFGF